MSRIDCMCNRNTKIITTYVNNKTGNFQGLFDGLEYSANEYTSPADFFLNEDEWTTFENFDQVFRRAKAMVNEPNFYYKCGASPAALNAWGRFYYFVKLFAGPGDGYKKLPFFNKNSNDIKEIEIVQPPAYDLRIRKYRTILKVTFHEDFSPEKGYVGDPYLRGILSSIPTIWGLPPAEVLQPLSAYNPVILFNEDPEFATLNLDVRMEGDILTLNDPNGNGRIQVGEKVLLESDVVHGQKVFLGKCSKLPKDYQPSTWEKREALLITRNLQKDDQMILNAGEIYRAPYFILNVTYDRVSLFKRLSHVFRFRQIRDGSSQELFETIDQLRRSITSKHNAYLALEKSNVALRQAKQQLDEYAKELERKVEERTAELQSAQQELLHLNRNLETTVREQVVQLERYNELRRYLSAKLTNEILNGKEFLEAKPRRKLMTAVFTDIRGFSNVADSLEPEELVHLLDKYLSEMIKIVHDHDGTLNKIVGDGLLIFFGDPIDMPDHCERAVQMAVEMQKKVLSLKNDWVAYGHELGVGIGINSAYMTVGNMGSDMHRDYTVIGNQVNVASRLESQAAAGQILISQRTYSKIQNKTAVEPLGTIRVKGIHDPVKTYNVLWEGPKAP